MGDTVLKEVTSSEATQIQGLSSHAASLLSRKYEQVYKEDKDRGVYLKPSTMRGISTKKLDESSPEWNPSWESLNSYLKKEETQQLEKAKTQDMLKSYPPSGAEWKQLKAKHKLHQDNCSKHVKIREIFGPTTTYHPNQLVAPQHLPREGLCSQDTMYKLACKVSNMQTLKAYGYLEMDPWDFIRWRANHLLAHLLPHAAARGSTVIKRVVSELGSHSNGRCDFTDPYLRELVLFAARFEHRSNCYGSRKEKVERNSKLFQGLYASKCRPFSFLPRQIATPLPHHPKPQTKKADIVKQKIQQTTTGYSGVNGYIQKQHTVKKSQE